MIKFYNLFRFFVHVMKVPPKITWALDGSQYNLGPVKYLYGIRSEFILNCICSGSLKRCALYNFS